MERRLETQWAGHLGLVGEYWERSIGEDLEEEEEEEEKEEEKAAAAV